MKPLDAIARAHIKSIKPVMHGGEVWDSQKSATKIDMLDFSSNVNPLGISPRVIDTIKKNLWRIPFYPDTRYSLLRRTIAENLGVDIDNIIVGNGSTEIIYLFCEVFLDNKDEAQVPKPSFGEYEIAVRRTAAIPSFFKLDKEFKIAPDKIDYNSKVIFLCNPNNPTSTITQRTVIVKILQRALKHDALVFVDEDFIEFTSNPELHSVVNFVEKYPNLFVLRSFTKFFGLTGLRVGYGVGSKEIIDLLNRVKPPWSVNCLAEVAAIAALNDKDFLRTTKELVKTERDFLFEALDKIDSFSPVKPDANFILVNVKTGKRAGDIKKKLLGRGILIRDCSSFGLPNYIRIAVRSREDSIRLLKALKEITG